jgi:DNA topoisomerase-2
MHAFNYKGIITKYDSLNDILSEFYGVRQGIYEKRRLNQIRILKEKFPYQKNVVKYIRDQIKDKPEVNLKKKSLKECDDILQKNKYELIDGSYEYIMKLPVSAFTTEKITKHEKDMQDILAEIGRLEKTSWREMWIADLEEL